MSKKNTLAPAPKIFGYEPEPFLLSSTPAAPKIVGVKPTGSQIMIELLTAQEVLGTTMLVNDDQADVGSPQAYVVAFGPGVKVDDISFKVGDRVLLQGSYVPIPKFDSNPRRKGLVEMHGIKAVLEESK